MPPRDHPAQQRLEALVARACYRKEAALEPLLLERIKGMCRQGDEHVLGAWEALWAQLTASHAQTRLLALQLCELLFARSRTFRCALLNKLTLVLEATVGFRPEKPLPPPAAAAASLREKALELLEGWDQEWGTKYAQLPLAVRYLRDTLHLQLPDIAPRAAAAAAERAAREERTRAGLRVRLAALLDTGEWQETAASARQLLREMDECFSLLAEQQAAAGRQGGGADGAAATVPVPAAEDDGLEWEDVPAAAEVAAAEPGGEGLAAYAQPEAQDDEPEGGQGDSDLDAVLETLAGLHRQLANRTLPQVQDALGVLGRAEAEGPAQEVAQQRALRAATELRGCLAAAKARCDAMDLDLTALRLRRARRAQAATAQPEHRQQDGAVAAALQDLFGDSSDSDSDDSARPQDKAAGPGGRQQQPGQRQGRPGQRQRQRHQRPEDDQFVSPYRHIVDPTAPRPRPTQQQQQQQQGGSSAARRPPARTSSLPEEVRRRLAEQAPVLPTGPHTLFWDSKSVPTFVSGHGLEVSNHWGPVDVHQELPPERVDELFLLPMPASRHSSAAASRQPQNQAQPQARQAPQQERQQERNGREAQPQQQGQGGGAAPAPQAAGAAPPAVLQPWPSLLGTLAGPSAAGEAAEGREAKRARRAQERAYNEAIIGGARSDELVARQLAEAEQQAQAANGSRRRGKQPRKISVRERLAQKLLHGGARAAVLRDATTAETEQLRERAANRW